MRNFMSSSINSKSNTKMASRKLKRTIQMLIMLGSTNLYFLLSSMPYFLLYYVYNAYVSDEVKSSNNYVNLLIASHVFAYSNNAANFILYGIFSSKYRQEIVSIFVGFRQNAPIIRMRNYNSSKCRSTI